MTSLLFSHQLDMGTRKCDFSVAFSPDGDHMCIGGSDSIIYDFLPRMAFSPSSIKISSAMSSGSELKSPVVCMKFKPDQKNMLTVLCTDGSLTTWHINSYKLISSTKEGSEMYTFDYNINGTTCVVGGKDSIVTVYDAKSMKCIMTLRDSPKGISKAHTSRIQCVRFLRDSNYEFVSGGWDNMVNIWDTRQSRAVAAIYGPYICGDGLDVCGNILMAASSRSEKQLQLFDLRKHQLLYEMTIPPPDDQPLSHLYCGRISNGGGRLVVGGTHILKAFDIHKGAEGLTEIPIKVENEEVLNSAFFSVSWIPSDELLCVTGDKSLVFRS
eukprot:Tbor_TRINITY_DN5507_c0_g3::TRINITY_DN5507_c0_g3_i2::g.12889::m.12889